MARFICTVQGCDRPEHSRGYCNAHYQQVRKGKEPGPIQVVKKRGEIRLCTFPNCDRAHRAKGLCDGHLQQQRAGKTLTPLQKFTPNKGTQCRFEGCDREAWQHGLCGGHEAQRRKGQQLRTLRPINSSKLRWGGTQERDAEGRKQCTQCATWKSESAFGAKERNTDRLDSQCKACRLARYKADKEKHQEHKRLRTYGVTATRYKLMAQEQKNVCAICGKPPRKGHVLVVDHNHKCCSGKMSCGKCVRALLCGHCNRGIGFFGDDIDALLGAAAYLTKWKTVVDTNPRINSKDDKDHE